MYGKQHHLNRAYYRPSIHSLTPYNRVGCGGKFILIILSILGIGVFLMWLIVRPTVPKFKVVDASLIEFNYTATNNTLHYNLTVNIIVHNPNKWISVYYNFIKVRALYHGTRFDTYSFDHFYQDRETTSVLRHVFKGQHVVVLSPEQKKMLNKEKSSGVYNIHVKMHLKVRFKLGMYKTKTLKPKVTCHLHVPFKSANAGRNFQVTKCGWNS